MSQLPTAGPWASHSERIIDQALSNALAGTPEQIRAMRPVAAPQALFPPRQGFAQEPPTIMQVLNIDRQNVTYRSWVSGVVAQPEIVSDYTESSSRNSMTQGVF